MNDLRYPAGKFEGVCSEEQKPQYLADIDETPARLGAAVQGLTPTQFDTPYRPGGWTVRQVVHHLPDSHINSFMFASNRR